MRMQPSVKFFILALFFSLLTHTPKAQQPLKTYNKEWEKVDELLVKKNLPQSALNAVKKIYAQAKKEKQEAQVIKALVYMAGLQQETREQPKIASILDIEKEIATARQPSKSILQSLLAEYYRSYYEQQRWQLYNRTETKQFKKEDIATWSAGDFHKKMAGLFLASISQEALLKNTKLEKYDAIILKGNVRHLRPTLFDLLANRALEYFKDDEQDITRPSYAFEISTAAAFDPAADFIHRKFETPDPASLHQKALLLYQGLLEFHMADKNPDALIDVDISRLLFVKENSTHPDKESLYRLALTHLINQYKNIPAAAQAEYLLAKAYNEDADGYQPLGDTSHRFDRLRAKAICEKVLAAKDSSEGWVNCYNLLQSITKKELSFQLEKVNLPGQAFRVLTRYRNLSSLYLRLVRADQQLIDSVGNYLNEKSWEYILQAPVYKTWQQILPDTKDYQLHSTEIPVEGLGNGVYFLIASSSDDFTAGNAVVGARLFYVSRISYVNQGKDYFVLDRETGHPLTQAAVQTWQQVYDYRKSAYTTEKGKRYSTDNNGFFRLADFEKDNNARRRENYRLEITYGDDQLFMDDWAYDYYWYRNNTEQPQPDILANRRTFFFTDRSIYRPGQTVFFKAISIIPDPEKTNRALTDFITTIYLRDANYQLIDSLVLTTNDYGSVSGKFQLPASGLNGQFSISEKENKGNVFFSVEEYKRPRFFVDYEKIRDTYGINDTITLTGMAKAYAGNMIDGATVQYRVVREPRYLYPWLYSRWWQPPSPSVEIAHGTLSTDGAGKFIIRFAAIPDKTIDKKLEPVFDYTIYADVTDINGETRSGETRVTVGYHSLLFNNSIPDRCPVDSMVRFDIRTENMNGEFQPSLVTVTVSLLQEEKRLIRQRYWDQPDQHVMTKEEYLRLFPHDEYADESSVASWEKMEAVYSLTDSIKAIGSWNLDTKKLAPGFYKVEISTLDKNGERIKDIHSFEIYDESGKGLNHPAYLWTSPSASIEPGEKTTIGLGSSAAQLFVIEQTDQPSRRPDATDMQYQTSTLSNEIKRFPFTAEAADRGGYGVTYFFIKDNRFFQFTDIIRVPWSNKDLHVEFASFRDKTLPGSTEKWKLKITGNKNEKVAAEVLASMYDASLDQFKPHQWYKPSLWPSYYNRVSWNSEDNFSEISSVEKWREEEDKYFEKEYDQLQTSITNFSLQYDVIQIRKYTNAKLKMKAVNSVPDADGLNEVVVTKALSGRAKGFAVEFSTDSIAFGFSTQYKPVQTETDNTPVQVRKNFNETAFFFPDLYTDSSGMIEFSFTAPEALTKWKLQTIAHTRGLAFGLATKELITQKELMVQPNAPRFLREGDKMEFSTKVVNLSDQEITGQAQLLLFDAATHQPVDGWFQNMFPNQYFTVAAGQSEAVKFPIEVPYLFNKALTWRIVARAGDKSDGEEASLPVLTNRMLVTESLPLNMKGPGTKAFRFEKLLRSGESETLKQHALTVEYSGNPAWYAVQALPYLMEYPYECAEQTWNRYYANSLASMMVNSSPKIKQVFEKWKNTDTAALISNLQKNEELKSVLLEETPWVLEAKNETEQKKNIALLFDLVRMQEQLNNAIEKLQALQSPNGGFVWFRGGPDDRYITHYIITGIGHLFKLKAVDNGQKEKLEAIVNKALPYLDKKIREDFENLKKSKANINLQQVGYTQIQYLYMRSFFKSIVIPAASQSAYQYYFGQACRFWMKQNKYAQGMIALFAARAKDSKTAGTILKSLQETSILQEELGRYWNNQGQGWRWYQAPVETQALLIEAFSEIAGDTKTVNELKTWLLRNKQTNNWKTTKATAEACYALLLQGGQWLSSAPAIAISLGDAVIDNTDQEEGTGYFKKRIDGSFVSPSMGNITVTITPSAKEENNQVPSWGSVYWQYFEDLDKITPATTPLSLVKKLFVETNTDKGPVLTPVNEGDYLKVGDKIKVRIALRADRDMEYVHMKDMRASCMEPVNVLSGYRWQGGLGYYETTRDAGTHFFFDNLRKGTYVFEYTLFVTHKGDFSNGITSIQCMYAPEFSAHSEGIRVNVE
ncbi:MAG: alpha-2-macroglobulin [Terrimonas sp.]|nr:alpha-2-macroglobulin [Terrimonas sp.]